MERVNAYIDGLNVYQGIAAKGWRHLLWLDYRALVESLLQPDQQLGTVYYFTAPRTVPQESHYRQLRYFDALEQHGGVTRVDGYFDRRRAPCVHCGRMTDMPRERATDVSLATQMVADAAHDRIDTAMLISGDSDYLAPVSACRDLGKTIKLCDPPSRRASVEMVALADNRRHITKRDLARHLLPDPVAADGREIDCPFSWLTVEAKIRRLGTSHQAYLGSALLAVRPTDRDYLHQLVNELWRRERKATGPHSV